MKHKSMRVLSLVLSLLLIIGCVPSIVSAEDEKPMSELSNLAYILDKSGAESLRVVYLGGSVTDGVGASNMESTGWRALVGQWFTEKAAAKGKTVENINAAIGATGSYFGAYRFYQDAKCAEKAPDVLFLEFSINDGYDAVTGEQAAFYYESILRQAYAENPKMQIIPVFTTDAKLAADYLTEGSEGDDCFKAHEAIADWYHLPKIYVGRALADRIKTESGKTSFTSGQEPWSTYITDYCHPNDAGYKIYADTVISYLEKQLGDTVRFTGEYTDVSLPETTYCETTYPDSNCSLIKAGRYVSFKDAGFNSHTLNGFTLTATTADSYKQSSNGKITAKGAGASFAYTFTGTGTAFFNQGYPASGKLSWKITAVGEEEKTYSGVTSLIKKFDGGLPIPADLKAGLENRKWLVECVLLPSENGGTTAELRYIYVDGGDEAMKSVAPAPVPDTSFTEPPITVKAVSMTKGFVSRTKSNCTEDGTYADVEIDGISARDIRTNTGNNLKPFADYHGVAYNASVSFPETKVLSVTYYYEDSAPAVTNQSVLLRICSLVPLKKEDAWIAGAGEDTGTRYTQRSAPVVTGKWVTQYFDYGTALSATGKSTSEWLAETYPGRNLSQIWVGGFGTLGGGTIPAGDKFALHAVSFHTEMPKLYNASGEEISVNDGSAIVYVSEKGSVTVDGTIYKSYYSIADAMKVLCPVGGTIKFDGTQSFAESADAREKITLIGLDDTAVLSNASFALKGDLYLDNLTMEGAGGESWTYTDGYTLTFGKNFKIKNNKAVYYGRPNGGKANKIDFYNGTFGLGGAAAMYRGNFTVTGDTVYNCYGGTFGDMGLISRNGCGETNGGTQTVNGDIYLNLCGGTFHEIYPTTTTGILNGSAFITVSGGSVELLSYASQQGPSSKDQDFAAPSVNGDYVIILNNADIQKAETTLEKTKIGVNSGSKAIEVSGNKIIVSNNHELIGETKLNLSGNKADVVLTVSGGSATLVRDEETKLVTGYKLTADKEGTVPYINGVLNVPENGIYPLAKGETAVVFKDSDSIDILYTDGDSEKIETTAKAYGTITLPVCSFKKSGYVFVGWKTADGIIHYPYENYTLRDSAVTFTAQWVAIDEITTVYVKQSATVNGTGLAEVSPVMTIADAIKLAGADRDFTVMFVDDYNESLTGNYAKTGINHTGTVTYSSTENGSFGWSADFNPLGPAVFKDITLKVRASNNFVTNGGNLFTVGTGVKIASFDGKNTYYPQYHIGLCDVNTPFQTFEVNSGSLGTVYIGAYYINGKLNSGNYKETAGAKVTVNGGSVRQLTLGPDSYGDDKNGYRQGDVHFTDTVTVLYNGGTIGSVSRGTPNVTYKATQFIANNGLSFPALPNETDNGERYVVLSGEGGMVYDTETTGTFRIIPQTNVLYIDGVRTAIRTDNLYTLAPGNHTVSYYQTVKVTADGTEYRFDETNDRVAIAAASTVSFDAESIPERDGELFIGWFKNGNAVKIGDELSAGDVLDAHFLKFSVKEDFKLLGAQVRLTEVSGLRFVQSFSLEKFNAMKNLLGDNFNQKAESDDSNSGCGFLIVPTSLIDEGATVQTDSDTKRVDARKIFDRDENSFLYTVCVTGIEEYTREYTVVPYITFTNRNGVTQTIYGEVWSTTLAKIADWALVHETLTEDQEALLKKFAGKA